MQNICLSNINNAGSDYTADIYFYKPVFAGRVAVFDEIIDAVGNVYRVLTWAGAPSAFVNGTQVTMQFVTTDTLPVCDSGEYQAKIREYMDIVSEDQLYQYTVTAGDTALDSVEVVLPTEFKYLVGSGDLEVDGNGLNLTIGPLSQGYLIEEVGTDGTLSTTVNIKGSSFSEGDVVTIKRESTTRSSRFSHV